MTALRLALTELRRIGASRVGRLALVAMVLVPSIYGGLYLYANDDPYGGLNRVPAALVVEDAGTVACDASKFDGDENAKLMRFDNQDGGVYWNELAGGKVYCIGVNEATGDDIDGTFLRSALDTGPASPTNYPTFITTVDRTTDVP